MIYRKTNVFFPPRFSLFQTCCCLISIQSGQPSQLVTDQLTMELSGEVLWALLVFSKQLSLHQKVTSDVAPSFSKPRLLQHETGVTVCLQLDHGRRIMEQTFGLCSQFISLLQPTIQYGTFRKHLLNMTRYHVRLLFWLFWPFTEKKILFWDLSPDTLEQIMFCV